MAAATAWSRRAPELERRVEPASIIGGLFVAVGAVLLWLSRKHQLERREFMANSSTAPGVIVAMHEDSSGRDQRAWFPEVRFTNPRGMAFSFRSAVGGPGGPERVGEQVVVRYRADRPGEAEIDSFLTLWGVSLLFGLLGAAFLAIGLFVLAGVVAD